MNLNNTKRNWVRQTQKSKWAKNWGEQINWGEPINWVGQTLNWVGQGPAVPPIAPPLIIILLKQLVFEVIDTQILG